MTNEIFSVGSVTRTNRSFTPSNQIDRSGEGSANVVSINVNKSLARAVNNTAEIKRQANQLNEFVKQSQYNLEYSVDDSSGVIVITVKEEDTGKIIRQIPAEEFIAIANLLRTAPENQGLSPGLLIADEG